MSFYVRRLPHWQPPNQPIFLTWRLYGSLPANVLVELRQQRESAGHQFLKVDRALDKAPTGPFWLGAPEIARCVMAALNRGDRELRHYSLHAFVVMPNHVHAY